MIRTLAALTFAASATVVSAQDHSGHQMPMAAPAAAAAPATAPGAPVEAAVGTDLQPGSASAPAAPTDRYGDRYWPPAAMAASRDALFREHGGGTVSMVAIDIAEWQPGRGSDRFRWNGEGWWGGDIHRLTVKSEGQGEFGGGVEEAEVQALYSRAVDAYWNLQAGVRQDLQSGPKRTYATVGVEGLAPYWFEVEGALFLSNKGEVLARTEIYYDQRLTQRLILQPRAEVSFAFQNVAANGVGRGVSEASLDLRLRYEVTREFAPYVGVSTERKFGRTADFARAAGEDRSSTRLVLGVRAWF